MEARRVDAAICAAVRGWKTAAAALAAPPARLAKRKKSRRSTATLSHDPSSQHLLAGVAEKRTFGSFEADMPQCNLPRMNSNEPFAPPASATPNCRRDRLQSGFGLWVE